jgi:hypothetical protein
MKLSERILLCFSVSVLTPRSFARLSPTLTSFLLPLFSSSCPEVCTTAGTQLLQRRPQASSKHPKGVQLACRPRLLKPPAVFAQMPPLFLSCVLRHALFKFIPVESSQNESPYRTAHASSGASIAPSISDKVCPPF